MVYKPEGHPKRVEQDSQMIENDDPSSPKKNKKKKNKREEDPMLCYQCVQAETYQLHAWACTRLGGG